MEEGKVEILKQNGYNFLWIDDWLAMWDIPGEIKGKASNEAWAAKIAKQELVDKFGWDFSYQLLATLEESAEMFGIAIFLKALMKYINLEITIRTN